VVLTVSSNYVLRNVNQFVFVMVKFGFLFEVWNELLNIIHTDFSFNGINGDEASCE
jgi:hypothetical protein